MLGIGDKVPDIRVPLSNGTGVSLADFEGKKIVLYFYPKDDTPGCTKEACAFRDMAKDFSDKNVVIIGVSKDSMKSHEKFINKYKLPFELISDEEGRLLDTFGVWKEKSMYGKTFMGIERTTFLIDEKGKIEQVWRKVSVDGHIEDILSKL